MIFKPQDRVVTHLDESENVIKSEDQITTEFIRKEKKVRDIPFRVPEKYFIGGERDEHDLLGNNESTGDTSENEVEAEKMESELIGSYSKQYRLNKILKFKEKLYKRRANKPISKVFKGRSQVANQKLRVNGKFVKKSLIFALKRKAEIICL